MTFKVRATRDGNGGYDLAYGKGVKKITARAAQAGGGKWTLMDFSRPGCLEMGCLPHSLARCKQVFETFCRESYGKDPEPDEPQELRNSWIDDGEEFEMGDEPPEAFEDDCQFPDTMTDVDVVALQRLVGRYGQENIIKLVRGWSSEQTLKMLARGRRFREAFQKVHFGEPNDQKN